MCTAAIAQPLPAGALPPQKSADYYLVEFPPRGEIATITCYPGSSSTGTTGAELRLKARGLVRVPRAGTIKIELLYDGPENMSTLEQLDANQVLRFSAAKLEFEDKHLAHLKKFKNLIQLNLDTTVISDKSLPVIGSFLHLQSLRANGTDITGDGFGSLCNCHALHDLNFDGINFKPGSIAKLKCLAPSLADLKLSHLNLPPSDVQAIAALTAVHHLDLEGIKQFDNQCVKMLLPLKHLTVLNIADTAANYKCLPDLNKFPELKRVLVRNNTFWPGGKPGTVKSGLSIIDCSKGARVPLEMFSPLH